MAHKTKEKQTNTITPNDNRDRKPVNVGVRDANREQIATALQTLLADLYVLENKTRGAHWNVEGKHFGSLHAMFEEHYGWLAEMIDETAERIRAFGALADCRMSSYIRLSRLEELPNGTTREDALIETLMSDHETMARHLRKEIPRLEDELHDIGTADFMTELLKQHEQVAWMLRVQLTD